MSTAGSVQAIVLAAGKSERMGRPKALLPFRGQTFLSLLLESIRSSPLGEAVVVLGHEHEAILDAVGPKRWVVNFDYESGMTSSFQAGIRYADPDVGAVLFLVDHPAPRQSTIARLLGEQRPDRIVVPRFEGRRGHPVLFGREALDEILDLGPDQGANQVVRRSPGRVIEVEVSDTSVLVDLDTPSQFEAWISGQTRGSALL